MAKKSLEEEYRKLLEENSRYEQIIEQKEAQLLSLDKEISEAERTIRKGTLVPQDLDLKNTLKKKKEMLAKNLELETQKFNDLMCKQNAEYKEIGFLRKQVGAKLQIKKKLDQQLAKLAELQAELRDAQALDALNEMSDERQMLKLKMSIDEEKLHFQNTKERLKITTECAAKLQTFIAEKCQTTPHKEKKTTEVLAQQETKELSSSDQLGATGGDPEIAQNTETQSSYFDVHVRGLKEKQRMLEESITNTKKDIHMLEQENENVSGQRWNLEDQLEKLKKQGDSLEDQKTTVQETLKDLEADIRRILKDVQKPAYATADILSCIDALQEYIDNLHIHPSEGTHAKARRPRTKNTIKKKRR